MAHIEVFPPSPAGAAEPAFLAHAATSSQRHDGWTADRQRIFLQALSEGDSVTQACKLAGLSARSAYAFRNSARGASFALGWQAAQLLAREALADDLLDRARNGTRCVHFSADGETYYNRHDNHLAFKMLSRLDRLACTARNEASHAAARLVAGEFEQYLDMIGRDGGPARAGLFLGARLGAEGVPASDDDLAPVRTLARADRWLRTHIDLADPLAMADLDPAQRADWTAEQWVRAEAAGLVAFAPPPSPSPGESRELREHIAVSPLFGREPVWWNEAEEQWETHFPPPEGFTGLEDGEFGDEGYSRTLSDAEEATEAARMVAALAAQRAEESRDRDRYFGFTPAAPDAPDAPDAPERDEIADEIAPPPAPLAPLARSRRSPRKAGQSQENDMGIFSRMKDAILGRGGGIFGQDAPAPGAAPQGQAQPAPAAPTPQNQQAAAPAQTVAPVDVEQVLTEKLAAKGNPDLNWRTSIVDLMKLLDIDSSLENRKELATELGYAGAKDGSAEMNIWLHNAVMMELANNGAKVPEKLTD